MAPLLFLAPALLMFALYVLWPIASSFWTSLYDWDGIGVAKWVGLRNYRELFFEDDDLPVVVANNVKWLILYLLAPPAGLALALLLNREIVLGRLAKSLFFFPFVISPVVIGLVFSFFYDPYYGLLNRILGLVGLGPFSPLSDERWATYGVIVAGLWPQIAYCMVIYLTGLTAVRHEIVEAARIDGARRWSMLRFILLPELRPATFIAVVVTVIGALRSFDLLAIMTRGGPFGSTKVLAFKMYEEALGNYRAGYGAAVAVLLFLIMSAYIGWALTRMLRREA